MALGTLRTCASKARAHVLGMLANVAPPLVRALAQHWQSSAPSFALHMLLAHAQCVQQGLSSH